MPLAADFRGYVRNLIEDLAGSHVVRREDLRRSVNGNQVDGVNKDFILNNQKFITGTLTVSPDGGAYITPPTLNATRGTFSLTTAPATSLIARYDFQNFLDAEVDEHVNNGLRFVGIATPASVPFGLEQAVILESAASCFNALASRTAHFFDASVGGKGINKASIKQHYLALAKEKHAMAVVERDEFHENKGENLAPAYGKVELQHQVYTPRR